MIDQYWLKQTANKPLFPEILWSRPENRQGAGKLLIVGGNAHGITAPASGFAEATAAGVGAVRVILPDHVRKSFGLVLAEAEFAPSNPSGGFALKALDEILSAAHWADAVLLAGDFGHNSETSILVEHFLEKSTKPVIITHDAIETTYGFTEKLIVRPNTFFVVSFAQAQKLAIKAKSQWPLKFDAPLQVTIETLHNLTTKWQAGLLTRFGSNFLLAYKGQVISSPAPDEKVWRVKTAAKASVFWLQNPQKLFESVAASIVQ